MGTPLYMELGDACQIVQDYADVNTGRDILAALAEMEANYDDLEKQQRVAYRMFMAAGREMFKAKDDPNVYYGA